MRINKLYVAAILLSTQVAFSGCVKEEEGPYERIGRSIDDLSGGIRDASEDWGREEREKEDREREERHRAERDRRLERQEQRDYEDGRFE